MISTIRRETQAIDSETRALILANRTDSVWGDGPLSLVIFDTGNDVGLRPATVYLREQVGIRRAVCGCQLIIALATESGAALPIIELPTSGIEVDGQTHWPEFAITGGHVIIREPYFNRDCEALCWRHYSITRAATNN